MTPSPNEYNKLRALIEEYMISFKLDKFDNIAHLSSKICNELVEVVDNEIERLREQEDVLYNDQIIYESRLLIKLVENVCNKLREQSKLAQAYSDVIDFVRQMVCVI